MPEGGAGRPFILIASSWAAGGMPIPDPANDWSGAVLAATEPAPPTDPWRGLPAVGGIDLDLMRPGESLRVDGTGAFVELLSVKETPVVTSFLEDEEGRVLLVRRSEKVGSYQGRWSGISGYQEEPTPLAQAVKEIQEETGIAPEDLRLVAEGSPVYVRHGEEVFVVHPFRFRVPHRPVRLDWENVESEWVPPSEIPLRSTVPKLDRAWEAVAVPGDRSARKV
ncbi:MAG: NUDIX domain-containing protein [Thermoplasmata archaeon]